MEQSFLLVTEVAAKMRLSVRTIYRLVEQIHSGRAPPGQRVPMPVSKRGEKLRWLASDFEKFLESQATTPVQSVTTTKQRKKREQEYEERQRRADQALERHGLNKTKGKPKKK